MTPRERRTFALTLALLVLVVGALVIALGTSSPATRVAIIGDSITVQSSPALHEAFDGHYRLDIRAQSGRRIDEMLPALEQALHQHPRVVIVNLGTNDALQHDTHPDWRPGYDRMVRDVATTPCVVAVDISTVLDVIYDRAGVAGAIDDALRRTAAANDRIHILDWDALVRATPTMLSADEIHPSPAGRRALADALRHAVDRDCRGGSAVPDKPSYSDGE